MKYMIATILILGFCSLAAAKDMEIAWTGGYFFRPADDAVAYDGPGTGVTISRFMIHDVWIEGELLYGWDRRTEVSESTTESRKWSGTRLLFGVYKRWPSGRVSWFAGGGMGFRLMNETFEATWVLPDENDVPRTFHEVHHDRYNDLTIAGKIGGIANVNSKLLVRFEAELAAVSYFIPNIGTSIGLAWRF